MSSTTYMGEQVEFIKPYNNGVDNEFYFET